MIMSYSVWTQFENRINICWKLRYETTKNTIVSQLIEHENKSKQRSCVLVNGSKTTMLHKKCDSVWFNIHWNYGTLKQSTEKDKWYSTSLNKMKLMRKKTNVYVKFETFSDRYCFFCDSALSKSRGERWWVMWETIGSRVIFRLCTCTYQVRT